MKNQINKTRYLKAKIFAVICFLSTIIGILILTILLIDVMVKGINWVNGDFLNNYPSRFAKSAGVKSALWGSIWLMLLIALIAIPIGIASAIYLEEFLSENKLKKFIELNIYNLAGVPAIIYGILGLAVFVRFFHLGRSLISGALTMALLILPTIIVTSQEAIKAVSKSLKEAAYSLGATKWQTVKMVVLPIALPWILTGSILSLSRAIGEAAPLIMIGALTFVAFTPKSIYDPFTTLPIQIFNWTSRPQKEFQNVAAAGIIVLIVILLLLNSTAIFLRNKFARN